QAVLIFAIGVFVFPYIGLPELNLPADIGGLILVTFFCGWCAVSYATCIGVFANTEEQSNGFGAIPIVILAAVGGLMVPAFAMPSSFNTIMKLSPMHWCLEAYYGLFLEGGKLKDIFSNILSLIFITFILQVISFIGLKYKKLV
ncbi:MAG: ABC transporter permease, partial [Chitinophagaceae bacterium]